MKPIWAEVPMLYTLSRWTQGLVPYVKPGAWSKGDGSTVASRPPPRRRQTAATAGETPRTRKRRDEPGTDLHLGAARPEAGQPWFLHGGAARRASPPAWLQRLEALSGYRHVFSPPDPNARLNPVLFSHLVFSLAGRRCHVLSRVCDAGLDHTQRTNKFAHHVVLDPRELVPGGPAWLLAAPGFMQSTWDGVPKVLPAGRQSAARPILPRRFAGHGSRSRAMPAGAAPWPRRPGPARTARR